MICNALADTLALESRPVSIVITKVGGVEEELITKLYNVPVYNTDEHRIQVIQAVDITQISEGSPNGNLNEISRIFNIPRQKLHRNPGPVDLLVGINYPQFHAGETKITEKLAVRKSPLGWVVFGAGTEGITIRDKHVLHVRLTSAINLTDFWETESMGVASSSCKCLQVKTSVGEQHELKLIEESCKLVDKQWTVNYPWKRDPTQLPDESWKLLKLN